jgi:methyltransferase (TIGR00027 family)
MDSLGLTSRWVAAARARESARPDRLFEDELADALAGAEGWAMLREMERAAAVEGPPQENPILAIRTRFLDDLLLDAANRGTRQFVLLAAGMDARAFRLVWPDGSSVFEVERDDVLAYKEEVLARLAVSPRARRVLVSADLREDWRSKLARSGHDASQPTALLVEGLLPYLPDESAALAVLSEAATVAAAGSCIGLDVISQSFLRSPWTQSFVEALAARDVPWNFGTDEPEALLARAGWSDVRAVQPGEAGVGADRWPYPTVPRGWMDVPRSFLVSGAR